jgi:putative copper export protein
MTSGLLLPLSLAVVLTALLLMIGAVTCSLVVLRAQVDQSARAGAHGLGGVSAVCLLLGLLGTFSAQLLAFNLPPDPLLPDARVLLVQPWGRGWSAQVVLALLAIGGFAKARPSAAGFWPAATAVLVLLLAFTPGLTGHAAGEEARALAVSLDGLHVLAAGMWLGTLAALSATMPWSASDAGTTALRRIRRFSPIALASAPIVAGTGVASGWLRVAGATEFWSTPYVRWLALKVLLFVGVLALGFLNWRRTRREDPRGVRTTVARELLLAGAVVVVTAVLVNTPLPAVE